MENLRVYNTDSEYISDAGVIAGVTGSVVSYVKENSSIKYDGKNVIIPLMNAEEADIVVFDCEDLMMKVLKYGTYKSSTFESSRYVIGGVITNRIGNSVIISALTDASTSVRYAQGYKVFLSGFDFSTGGSLEISFIGSETHSGTINYTTSDTLSTVRTAIDAIADSTFTITVNSTYNCIIIEHNDYRVPMITILSSTPTITITELASKYQTILVDSIIGDGVILPANITRNKGLTTFSAGFNFERFKSNYSVSGSATSNLSETSSYILRLSAFNSTNNLTLFTKFNGNYDSYLNSEMVAWPISKGVMKQLESKVLNNSLISKNWIDIDGSSKPAYPAMKVSSLFGIVTSGITTGFEPGNWLTPTCNMLYLALKDRKIAGDDKVNLSLAVVGGTKLLPTNNYWTCNEYSSTYGWFFYGTNGTLDYSSKFNSFRVRSFLVLTIE